MNDKTSALDFPAKWEACINAGDLESLLNLYNENCVLIPTFTHTTIDTADGLQNYFANLTSRKCLEVELHRSTIHCQNIGDNNHIVTGTYSFKFEIDNTLLTFLSRFTFVINLNLDKPILHHHSSQTPINLPSSN